MLTCAYCEKPLPRRPPSKESRPFCSKECYWASMRGKIKKERTTGHRECKAPGHPIAPPSGIVKVARLVLFEKIGPGTHPCHWCKSDVTWNPGGGPRIGNLVADHLNWDFNDDSPGNLVPSCSICNAQRTRHGDRRRIEKNETTMLWGGVRTRAVQRFCNMCGAPFLTIPVEVRKGKGRFCSRSCARRSRGH
jgi:endogenous inhibitor of DNA gyrase (YacG/DUF329 family)